MKMNDVLNIFGKNTSTHRRDSQFTTEVAILNLHPVKGTHWKLFLNERFSDFCGFPTPKTV